MGLRFVPAWFTLIVFFGLVISWVWFLGGFWVFYDSGGCGIWGFGGGLDLRFCGGVGELWWFGTCDLGLFRGSSGCFWGGWCNIAFSGLVLFS